MFEARTMVVYGKNGTCRIEEIAEKKFSGQKRTYYILRPVHDQGATIYVPVDNEAAGKRMRQILSQEDARRLMEEISDTPDAWIANEKERKEVFQQMLNQGGRRELAMLIRTIYHQKKCLTGRGRKLHAADEQVFKEAKKLLYDEISVALGVDEKQVEAYVVRRLKEGEK